MTVAFAPEDPLLSAADVQSWLSVSRSTLIRLVDSGKFPKPIRVGQNRRWRRSMIEDWIHQQE